MTVRLNLHMHHNKMLKHSSDCGQPTLSEGVAFETASTTFGSMVSYFCVEGYEILSGNNELVCQQDGKWSGVVLTCSKIGK